MSHDLCLTDQVTSFLHDYSLLFPSSPSLSNGQSISLVEGISSKYETRRFTEGVQGTCLPFFLHSAHVEAAVQERGLKANLKTEAMIELLLDSSPSAFTLFLLNLVSL
jgi:hypothetical protein